MMRSISEIIQVIESKLHVYFEKIEPTKDVQGDTLPIRQESERARDSTCGNYGEGNLCRNASITYVLVVVQYVLGWILWKIEVSFRSLVLQVPKKGF